MRNDLDLPINLLADRNCVTQVSNSVVNLYLVMEEFLEGGDVEDFV